MYQVNDDCNYPKKKCSIHWYLTQNNPQSKIHILLKTRNI